MCWSDNWENINLQKEGKEKEKEKKKHCWSVSLPNIYIIQLDLH